MSPDRAAARRAALGLALVGLAACAAPAPVGDESTTAAAAAELRTYRVRGLVEALPGPLTGETTLLVRHEAIPELVGPGGEVEGMAAMTMPFALAGDLDVGGLAAGDRVRFVLEVDWAAPRPAVITAIEKLPSDTELVLD